MNYSHIANSSRTLGGRALLPPENLWIEFELALVLVIDETRLYLANPSKMVDILTTTETGSSCELELVNFQELERGNASATMSELVGEYGVVYITSLTRQGCSGCETQKPHLRISRSGDGTGIDWQGPVPETSR